MANPIINANEKRKLIRLTERILAILLVLAVVATAVVFFAPEALGMEAAKAASVKQGMTGSTVKNIQTKLKNWGYYSGAVDGIYGAATTKAVKAFQKKNKLTQDGVVGKKTAAAMGISLSGESGGGGSVSSDTYLLARCVYGEARGEPYVGQVAIAAVVLNRVRSAEFPNTIAGVIYQPWAFTAVNDGQINLSPNDTALRAAKDALNGWDPTNGSLFYYNPKTATNQWIRKKEVHLSIGRHVFCL